jgi:hypothetical protein
MDDVRSLADNFLKRFRVVADSGQGWDYPYAGWYQRLLGLAEAGWPQLFCGIIATCRMTAYPLMTFDRENGMSIRRRRRFCRYPLPGSSSRTTEVRRQL